MAFLGRSQDKENCFSSSTSLYLEYNVTDVKVLPVLLFIFYIMNCYVFYALGREDLSSLCSYRCEPFDDFKCVSLFV